MRRVELDVAAAEPGELAHLAHEDRRDVREERVERGVGLAGPLGRPEVREQRRARQGDLRDALRRGAQEHELLGREPAPLLERTDDRELGRALDLAVADGVGVPVAPQPGIDADAVEAVAGIGDLILEALPAVLAVGHDLAAGGLLLAHDRAHGVVLDRA